MTAPAIGVSDPSVSYNLNPISYYSSEHPFIDLMKYSRAIVSTGSGGAPGQSNSELRANGLLDEDGWPTSTHEDMKWFETQWNLGDPNIFEGMAGRYVVNWDGEGEVEVVGTGVVVHEVSEGKIVFQMVEAGSVKLRIIDTDPNGTGDYIQDVTVMKEEHVELYEAGQIFNPGFLDVVQDVRELRYMKWMVTNVTSDTNWDERLTPESVSYFNLPKKGVPVEVMVELANQTGTDPWFSLPVRADADYVRAFAEYVRDNLDPNLRATFETGNEVWNKSFSDYDIMLELIAEAGWDVSGAYSGAMSMYTKLSTFNAQIIDDVYGAQAEAQAVKALGLRAFSPPTNLKITGASEWLKNEPDTYIDPAETFDSLAIANYFGSKILVKDSLRTALEDAMADPQVDAAAWLYEQLLDPEVASSVPFIMTLNQHHKALADSMGLDLTIYEGGSHLDHSYNIRGVTDEVNSFIKEFAASDYMADLYRLFLEDWKELDADGPFNQFVAIAAPGEYGSFGLRAHHDDDNAQALALDEFNAINPAWWEDRGGEHFQQGVILEGTDADEMLDGTTQEDFLLGGAGNDTLNGGGEDDGLHGGDGNDMLIGGGGDDRLVGGGGVDTAFYFGDFSDFTITDGISLQVTETATGDTDTLTGIEVIKFADGLYDTATGTFWVGERPVSEEEENASFDGTAADDALTDTDGWQLIDRLDGVDSFTGQSTGAGLRIGVVNTTHTTGQELISLKGDAITATPIYYVTDRDWEFVNGTPDATDLTATNTIVRGGLDIALMNADILVRVEQIIGSAFDDTFSGLYWDETVNGAGGDDNLDGRSGDDTLWGGTGNDTITGGDGDDTLDGGAGIDIAVYDGVFADFSIVTDSGLQVTETATGYTDVLTNIEFIDFTDGQYDTATGSFSGDVSGVPEDIEDLPDDPFAGTAEDDVLIDTDGWQLIDGMEGVDSFTGQSSGAGLRIAGIKATSTTGKELANLKGDVIKDGPIYYATSHDWEYVNGTPDATGLTPSNTIVRGGLDIALMNADILVRVEKVIGSDFNDRFYGQSWDEVFDGAGGNDKLDGSGGNDILSGGAGNDTVIGGAGNDTLEGGEGMDLLFGGEGNDTFIHAGGLDEIDGGEGVDVFVLSGISAAEAQVTANVDGGYDVADSGGTTLAILTGVEEIQFLDESLALA